MSDQSNNPSPSKDWVLTPGGERPRENVHAVGSGESVNFGDAGNIQVTSPPEESTLISQRRLLMSQNLVLTPGGYRNRALVHRVEAGQALHVTEGKTRLLNLATEELIEVADAAVYPGSVPGFGTGWIAYAFWLNTTGNPVSFFRTTWRVPPAPVTQSGQTIFLFNGIDPSDPSAAILQPVLQWGASAAGGGNYWSVASWYVTGSGQAFHTTPVPVNVGDTLVGLMTLTGQSGSLFSYNCEFQGIAGTSLPVLNIEQLVWCNETLEAYSITRCSDYPSADLTALRSIDIQTGGTAPTLNWTPVNMVTDCGQHTRVVSNSATDGEVDIYYRSPKSQFSTGDLMQNVRILFGVGDDGGGIVMLPNGHIIRIPPGGPSGPLFREIAEKVTEVARGFAVREIIQGTASSHANETIERASLELMVKALEGALQSVKQTLSESSNG